MLIYIKVTLIKKIEEGLSAYPCQTVATPFYPQCKVNNNKQINKMLYQEFYIGKYDWKVCVFYDTTKEDTDEVMEYLFHIGCDGFTAQRAYQNLSSNEPNTGLTYSRGGNTCIVLGYATDRGNFAHTYVHEITHCAIHIARATGVDFESEELAYIAGDLAEVMLPFASKFMCACCDNN